MAVYPGHDSCRPVGSTAACPTLFNTGRVPGCPDVVNRRVHWHEKFFTADEPVASDGGPDRRPAPPLATGSRAARRTAAGARAGRGSDAPSGLRARSYRFGFTTRTLHGACVTTWLATLPINSLENPVRPCEPTTTRSTFSFSASSTMTCPG